MMALYLIAIAIAIGVFMIAAANFNWDLWFYDADSIVIGWIGGETMVRWYWGISGLGWIVVVVTHWIWGWWPAWL